MYPFLPELFYQISYLAAALYLKKIRRRLRLGAGGGRSAHPDLPVRSFRRDQ